MDVQKYEELLDELWNATNLNNEDFFQEILDLIKQAYIDGFEDGYREG